MASTKAVIPSVFYYTVIGLALAFFAAPALAQDKAVFTGYKGIMIGMPTSDVREKLGKANDQTDAEDYWEFSDTESARILYDEKKKVRAISVNYMGGESVPTPQSILGQPVEAKPDGSIFKKVEYRKDGFWISYVKMAGEDPMVIVTVQKLDRS
jgi:hypothetical protein